MYGNLMKQGWKMNDIDEMDIGFYFEVMDYMERKEEENEEKGEKEAFIDKIIW